MYPWLYAKSNVPFFRGSEIPNIKSPRYPAEFAPQFGYIKLKPTKAYNSRPTVMMKIFLNSILIVFFCLVKPISRNAKPKCIKKTSAVQIIIHTLFIVSNSIIIRIVIF